MPFCSQTAMEYFIESMALKVAAIMDSCGYESTFGDAWAGVINMTTMQLFASAQRYLANLFSLFSTWSLPELN